MSSSFKPFLAVQALLLASGFAPAVARAADMAADARCSAVISSPANGDTVAQNGAVSGRASVPEDAHLWVFARPKGFDGWWPQGGGAASVAGGDWQVTVFYGSPQDVGSEFEVVAMPVDGKVDASLRKWYATANAKGDFTPMRLPRAATGCQAAKVTVRRTS